MDLPFFRKSKNKKRQNSNCPLLPFDSHRFVTAFIFFLNQISGPRGLGLGATIAIGEDPAAHGHWCAFTDLYHAIPCTRTKCDVMASTWTVIAGLATAVAAGNAPQVVSQRVAIWQLHDQEKKFGSAPFLHEAMGSSGCSAYPKDLRQLLIEKWAPGKRILGCAWSLDKADTKTPGVFTCTFLDPKPNTHCSELAERPNVERCCPCFTFKSCFDVPWCRSLLVFVKHSLLNHYDNLFLCGEILNNACNCCLELFFENELHICSLVNMFASYRPIGLSLQVNSWAGLCLEKKKKLRNRASAGARLSLPRGLSQPDFTKLFFFFEI